MANSRPDPGAAEQAAGLESTASLLSRIRGGDAAARERLIRRFLPPLQRWARGRLPLRARDLLDTDDLVQVGLLRALNSMKGFDPRHEGAFLAYLRQIVLNQIRDEIRRSDRRPERKSLDEEMPEGGPSPLEQAIGKEALDRYERALSTLPEEHQEAVIMRVEMGFTHREVAEALGCPSANAARMIVARALVRLAEVMDER